MTVLSVKMTVNNVKITFSTDFRDQRSNIDHERTSGKALLA